MNVRTLEHPLGWISLRPPRAEDAREIWGLVEQAGSLDSNSPYAYLLLCTDFAATSAVAEQGGRIVAFVLGYCPPSRPEAWFVWQVAVCESHRGRGLASALLGHVFVMQPEGVAYLEATVTPSNQASRSLFQGFARAVGADCGDRTAFPSDLFPSSPAHEEEIRIRIGPLSRESLQARP